MMKRATWLAMAMVAGFAANLATAQTISLQQAIDMGLKADPRIHEQHKVLEQARGLLAEAQAHNGIRVDMNGFIGLAPKVTGGFMDGTQPRSDGNRLNGLSDWTFLQVAIIKPLYTFGKVERYTEAALGNVDAKRSEIKKVRANTTYDIKRAWHAHLVARDTRRLLEELADKVYGAQGRVEKWLKEENGQARQSDLYALQAGSAMLAKYIEDARAIEQISLDGLKILTGVGLKAQLMVGEERAEPLPYPQQSLDAYIQKALAERPEMAQLEAGLRARRALVEARRAEALPNIYTGLLGEFSYASRRDRLNNPYIVDPFNHAGMTPVLGMQWSWAGGVNDARVSQAQSELEQLITKDQFAQMGIPFEVAENYAKMQASWNAMARLAEGQQAARRWMVASYVDFEAGLVPADKVAEAMKTYGLTATEYLKTVHDYNLAVARMDLLTGQLN